MIRADTVVGDRCLGNGVSIGKLPDRPRHRALSTRGLVRQHLLGDWVAMQQRDQGRRFGPHRGRSAGEVQIGHVLIEDDVELGPAPDRSRYIRPTGSARHENRQPLVQVALLRDWKTVIVSQVRIAGSCSTGDNVILAGQVGIADHVTSVAGRGRGQAGV